MLSKFVYVCYVLCVILGTTYAFKIFTLGHIYCKISNLKFRGVITFIRLVYQLNRKLKKKTFYPYGLYNDLDGLHRFIYLRKCLIKKTTKINYLISSSTGLETVLICFGCEVLEPSFIGYSLVCKWFSLQY